MARLHEAGRLGSIWRQFPYCFHEPREHWTSLQRLAEAFRDDPLVLEIRHRSWDRAEADEWLRELGIGFCNIDQPAVSCSIALTLVVKSPVGNLRLQGRNATMWFHEDGDAAARYDYLYPLDELGEFVRAAEVISQRARETYVITNNHFRGQAALNALELRAHSFVYGETGLAGIVELACLAKLPVQRVARASIGTILTAMQLDLAVRGRNLIP